MNNKPKRILRKFATRLNKMAGLTQFSAIPYSNALTKTQEQFIKWNAERLNIAETEIRRRFFLSLGHFSDGHGGMEFNDYCDLTHDVFSVLYGDDEKELYNSYKFYGTLHFLRYLSYNIPDYDDNSDLVKSIGQKSKIVLVDYGCGLAQRSRSLANYYDAKNVETELHLFDIPTIREEFLKWLYRQSKVKLTFHQCTEEDPIPKIPVCDVLFALEFLEHVYNPMTYLEKFNASIKDQGIFVTNVEDHKAEFMHVSPVLQEVRNRLKDLKYTPIQSDQICQIYRKTHT